MKLLPVLILLTSCVTTQQPIPTCEEKITKQLLGCQVMDIQMFEKKSLGTKLVTLAAICDNPLRAVSIIAIDEKDKEVYTHFVRSGLTKDGQCTEQGILFNVFKDEEPITNSTLERTGI